MESMWSHAWWCASVGPLERRGWERDSWVDMAECLDCSHELLSLTRSRLVDAAEEWEELVSRAKAELRLGSEWVPDIRDEPPTAALHLSRCVKTLFMLNTLLPAAALST
mmetsp:Transcript_34466/g.67426  ORF Transcript_34466/g.67426 Transcript_34466/m.67426 type:complete len:109 (-) Transcript_34466:949-1275(-)